MSIQIDHVSYIYEQNTAMSVYALKDLRVTIPKDQFIGLIGHTGSGKSTFVQLLNALLKPTEGTVRFDGEDINTPEYDRKALRGKVGLVFQYPEHQLFEETVLKDVMFGPLNQGVPEEESRERAKNALRQVGMDESEFDTSPFDLSGGQKRRVAIAGVLAMQPEYLVLDEPTAGLDPRGRDEILELVQRMQKQLHITVLLVSHSMEDVARYVDRIMVINDGEMLYDGTPREVFANYRELEKIGLAAPGVIYIMQHLREAGIPADTDVLTAEEAAEKLAAVIGVKNA